MSTTSMTIMFRSWENSASTLEDLSSQSKTKQSESLSSSDPLKSSLLPPTRKALKLGTASFNSRLLAQLLRLSLNTKRKSKWKRQTIPVSNLLWISPMIPLREI
jgi:hypothetical protein